MSIFPLDAVTSLINGFLAVVGDNILVILGILGFALGAGFILGFLDTAFGWSDKTYHSRYTGKTYKLKW